MKREATANSTPYNITTISFLLFSSFGRFMLSQHVPVELAFGCEVFSAYFANNFAWFYSAQGFFMQRWRFGQGGAVFNLFAVWWFSFHREHFTIKASWLIS